MTCYLSIERLKISDDSVLSEDIRFSVINLLRCSIHKLQKFVYADIGTNYEYGERREGSVRKSYRRHSDGMYCYFSGGLADKLSSLFWHLVWLVQPQFLETETLASINLWMNGAQTRSSTHYDPHHNLLCVVSGSKQGVALLIC